MMSFSRSTQALFWMTRLVRLSPLASTAPLSTNFSPGFSDSFSGMRGVLAWSAKCDHSAGRVNKSLCFG